MTTTVSPTTRPTTHLCAALSLAALLALAPPHPGAAQSHHPPAEPPAEWGPISINLEGFEYPHPVEFMNLRVYDQDVRIAYMDIAPVGPANGRAAVFLHGGSYYGWYWKSQIEALANEGYRVVVKDRLGWGKSSKPILPYSMSLHASNTARLMEHLGISEAAIIGHSMGGQMATRFAFLYPEKTTHLVTINQIGLTDNRAGRGFRPFDGEIDADPDLQRAYEADVRTDTRRYVEWKPEYLDHLRIRHGQRLSGDWPRLAYVRRGRRQPALDGHHRGRLAAHQDEGADPRRRDRRTGLSRQRAPGRRDPAQRGGLSHPEHRPQPPRGGAGHRQRGADPLPGHRSPRVACEGPDPARTYGYGREVLPELLPLPGRSEVAADLGGTRRQLLLDRGASRVPVALLQP